MFRRDQTQIMHYKLFKGEHFGVNKVKFASPEKFISMGML